MSSFKLRKEKDCLNCGAQVEQTYCPHCGQENIELKENALHMVVHTIADYFHFDNKFFKTLKPLLYKPGFLPAEYVKGKRASYLHPIKMYIFISIVFFLYTLNDVNINAGKEKDVALKELDSTATAKVKTNQDSVEIGRTLEEYKAEQAKLPYAQRDKGLKKYLEEKNIAFKENKNKEEDLIKVIIQNIPKMMFVLLPLFAIILKMVYWRKKRYYYEHLIYSFHLHSALFLAFLSYAFFEYTFSLIYSLKAWLTFSLIIYMIWYTYRSLRVFYGSSRWITIFKLGLLGFFYNIILAICLLGLIGISIAMI